MKCSTLLQQLVRDMFVIKNHLSEFMFGWSKSELEIEKEQNHVNCILLQSDAKKALVNVAQKQMKKQYQSMMLYCFHCAFSLESTSDCFHSITNPISNRTITVAITRTNCCRIWFFSLVLLRRLVNVCELDWKGACEIYNLLQGCICLLNAIENKLTLYQNN